MRRLYGGLTRQTFPEGRCSTTSCSGPSRVRRSPAQTPAPVGPGGVSHATGPLSISDAPERLVGGHSHATMIMEGAVPSLGPRRSRQRAILARLARGETSVTQLAVPFSDHAELWVELH